MRRRSSPRLAGYAVLVAVGLVTALALRRPELAVVAAPFALLLAFGTALARDPQLEVDFSLDEETRKTFHELLTLSRTVFPYVEEHKFFCDYWFLTRWWNKIREFGALLAEHGFDAPLQP